MTVVIQFIDENQFGMRNSREESQGFRAAHCDQEQFCDGLSEAQKCSLFILSEF